MFNVEQYIGNINYGIYYIKHSKLEIIGIIGRLYCARV